MAFSYGCAKSDINPELPEESGQAEIQEPPIADVPDIQVAVPEVQEPTEKTWVYRGSAIEGNYADSDFVYLDNGKYRMYYAIEPEVPGNKLEVYSAISSDGISWKDESGTRIDTKNNVGLTFENVAGPTTIADGSRYIMAYSGAMPGKYKDAPNNRMAVLLWATSSDGLKFTVQGMVLDTRNDKYYGFADTPDLIRWDDGTIKLFLWGYFGIYESTFTGGSFTEPKMVYEAKDDDPMHRFPSSPPGDPTLAKIGSKWYMYYGQHTKGIFYATLEEE